MAPDIAEAAATATAGTRALGPLSFLHLARELRDMIYEDYLTIDGGYVFNPTTWKLKPYQDNNTPHPFALQYTCRLIAAEMSGLALTFNSITFTPIETLRVRAWQFEWLENMYEELCIAGVRGLAMVEYEGKFPSSVKESLSRQKPEYFDDADLDELFSNADMRYRLWNWLGAAESDVLGFTRLLLTQSEFAEFWVRFGGHDFLGLNLFCQPWMIPSPEELDRFWQVLRPMVCQKLIWSSFLRTSYFDQFFSCQSGSPDPSNRFKYRFSATAAAISFLHSLDRSTRLHIRRLTLDERTESVAHPERHGRGLVKFCDENPRLRVERRVNIWRTILPQTQRGDSNHLGRQDDWQRVREENTHVGSSRFWLYTEHASWSQAPNAGERFLRFPGELSEAISRWVLEALRLPNTITLVIDGEILPQLSSQMFREIVVADAVWQAASEESFSSGRLEKPPRWAWRTPQHFQSWDVHQGAGFALEQTLGYICEDFPNIIREILDGSSRVSLNFEVGGDSFDRQVEAMLAERKEWKNEDWYRAWRTRHVGKSIDPSPPLARDWFELFELDMLPKEEGATQATRDPEG